MINILLFFLNLVPLSICFWISFKRKRLYSVFFLGLIAQHIISIFYLNEAVDFFTEEVVTKGQLLMIVGNFVFFLLIFYLDKILLFKNKIKTEELINYTKSVNNNKFSWFIIFLSIFVLISLILSSGGVVSLLAGDWISRREDGTSSSIIYRFSVLSSFIVYPSSWFFYLKKKIIPLSLSLTFSVIFILIIGSRAAAITLVCCIFFSIMFDETDQSSKIRKIGVLGLLGFLFYNVLRYVRGYGLAFILNPIQSFEAILQRNIEFSGGESDVYFSYFFVVDSDIDESSLGNTLIRILLIYVPRSLFPWKPQDITHSLWEDFFRSGLFDSNEYYHLMYSAAKQGNYGSLHPTFWGDAYYNLETVGFLIYPIFFTTLFIFVERFLYKRLRRNTLLFFFSIFPFVGSCYLFMSRGNIVIGMGYIAYLIPITLFLYMVYNLLFKFFSKFIPFPVLF